MQALNAANAGLGELDGAEAILKRGFMRARGPLHAQPAGSELSE